jgi:predicted kinase
MIPAPFCYVPSAHGLLWHAAKPGVWMTERTGTLYAFCGKIASGKSTLAASIAKAPRTILLSEDELLSRLYPGEIVTIEDYARAATRLRVAIGPYVEKLLIMGLDVVLDFQANTPTARAWFRSVFDRAGAAHELHLLEVSDEVCKSRLVERNASGNHQYHVSEADFDLFNSYVSPPAEDEGFNVVIHLG